MKRIIYTVAAAAAIITGGVATAAPAMASNPGNGALVITSAAQAAQYDGAVIDRNVVIAAGVTRDQNAWFLGTEVKGNLSVQGDIQFSGVTVDGNVSVSGPGSFLGFNNYASHLERDLNVSGSSGIYTGMQNNVSLGNWTQYGGATQIDGSLSFTGNTGGLYSGYPMHVSGSFTYTGDTGPVLDRGGMTVSGTQTVG